MKNLTLKSKTAFLILVLLLISSILATGCSKKYEFEPTPEPVQEETIEEEAEPEPEPETEWDTSLNYLTGIHWETSSETEAEVDSDAANSSKSTPLRPVAIVVENSYDARPQWGMDDPDYSPDIILEDEVEGGISRTVWFYADYHKLPAQIGPIRSARPPFIKFSELFDSIFIHWGLSHSKESYIGADTVFATDNVDHIGDSVNGLYGRDSSRNVAIEHRGVMYPNALPGAIDSLGFRQNIEADRFSVLPFNSEPKEISGDTCTDVSVYFSNRSSYSHWVYSEESGTYKSDSYKNNVERDNIIVLMDTTEYIYVASYQSTGVTYCNYLLSGGNGKYISGGKIQDFTWEVKDGKLEFHDTDGGDFYFNPGKSWIGWISANNGGVVSSN